MDVATLPRPMAAAPPPQPMPVRPARIAAIDWMRGFVMVLMIVDHASMAFDRYHLSEDSALYPTAGTMALPAAEFFTRWMTHICAPTFVCLAGLSLALSVERRLLRGADPRDVDRSILTRGAIIAGIDLTIVSLGSGYLNFGVLFAIGVSMMCMAGLRRLPWQALLAIGLGWFAVGEAITGLFWHPPGSAAPLVALTVATDSTRPVVFKYSVVPWLAIMMIGWAFGRHISRAQAGQARFSTQRVLAVGGALLLAVFLFVRWNAGYGDMFLHRADGSWQQWLHVSKYPPSLSYAALELGLMWVALAALMRLEPVVGVRQNGPMLVFGQTAMFFYLAHRLAFEVPATWFGLREAGDLSTTYAVSIAMLLALYPACRWYRTFKAAHPQSVLKYL